MATVDLVFRSVGERTRDISLELAIKAIRPDKIHYLEDIRPFSETVNRQLRIEHDCDYVVYVDADCLILEDLRSVIDRTTAPYVDCFVSDRFRGRIHCGVHITRIDLVREMAQVPVPGNDDKAYVLRPESRIRGLALRKLGIAKMFRNFDILHDHFQYFEDVFAKYALRELRSRTEKQRLRLEYAMSRWRREDHDDFIVAHAAVEYAQKMVPEDKPPEVVGEFIENLPKHAASEFQRLGIEEKNAFIWDELEHFRNNGHSEVHYGRSQNKPKIFGIGLSRTGTRSLTSALQIIGFDVTHYPMDSLTFYELANARYDLAILDDYDGVTDITVAPYYAQLDKRYPGSKFILTIREQESWLRSCRNHWWGRKAFAETSTPQEETHMKIRRLLRAAVYGCYTFNAERFAYVYEQHVKNVLEYFADRPNDLLVLDVCAGEHWDPVCEFLSRPVPAHPFPHKGNKVSAKFRDLEIFD